MHEMSIALSIIDAVAAKAEEEHAKKVNGIELEVGKLAGVEVESLKFCFSAAAKGTIAEGAALDIREIQPVGVCSECGRRFSMNFYYSTCDSCGSFKTDLVSGRELLIKSIILEE